MRKEFIAVTSVGRETPHCHYHVQISRGEWDWKNLLIIGTPSLADLGSSLLFVFVSEDIEAALPWSPGCLCQPKDFQSAQHSASCCGSHLCGCDSEIHVLCYIYSDFRLPAITKEKAEAWENGLCIQRKKPVLLITAKCFLPHQQWLFRARVFDMKICRSHTLFC